MDFGSGGKKASKKDNDSLDDLLGDLLSTNTPSKKKPDHSTPTRQRSPGGKEIKPSGKDDNFYSSLAAMADSDGASDISEADVSKVAHSIGGLDDMDADLFGGALSKSQNSGNRSNGKPTTPRRNTPPAKGNKSPTRGHSPIRSETPTSPPGSARGSLKRKPVKPPSPSTTQNNAPAASFSQIHAEPKPLTAPGKMSDLSSASESLIPGQKTTQRPDTAPKIKKKYDFGDFDPDDPLAGVLSDEDDDLSESDRPKSATRKPVAAAPGQSKKAEDATLESPRRRGLMERPPTRSGSAAADAAGVLKESTAAAATATKSAVKQQPQASGLFSDSDGDMLDGLGLDTGAPAKKVEAAPKAKPDAESLAPARSVFDSLLGKSSSSAAQLLEPKAKKQFVLDSKYSSSMAGSGDAKEDEDDFAFGSYQPSAASGSRPNSRRSVRFQDDDDIFGLDNHPSTQGKSPGNKLGQAPPHGMEWLQETTAATDSISPSSATTTQVSSGAPVATSTTATAAAATKSTPSAATPAKPPTPQKKAGTDSTPAVSTPQRPATANKTPSPRAWLGLGSDSDDDDLFKPKKSSARSAALPQSPAPSATASASPRVFPKKQAKKDGISPKPSPAGSAVATKDDSDNDGEEDDWLARAKSRRQQMLAKDSARSVGSNGDGGIATTPVESGRSAGMGSHAGGDGLYDGQSMKVDLSSLIMDSPKFGGSARNEMSNDIFSRPQSQRQGQGAPTFESPRTALSRTIHDSVTEDQIPRTSAMQANSQDARLKFAASTFGQEQPPTPQSQPFRQHQQNLPHQGPQLEQQQQGQASQMLHEQAQQLQQMLQNVQAQQRMASVASNVLPPSSVVVPPSYMQMSAAIELPDNLAEAHAKLRKVELEKSYTESLLESVRRRYEEEMMAVENSYKNRLLVVEDSNRKKEARLLEENEQLMQQHLGRLRQVEQEKSELSSSLYSRLEDLERDKAKDIEKVKDQHRLAIQTLKREHEEALERLAKAKNQEIEMVANANNTSKSLTAVVEQVQNNARDLGELHMKVEGWNRQGLDEREISLRSKDEQLRMLQERLTRQEEDNSRERKRLEELIARMETQLRDQTKSLEEERWKLKQDQARAEAQQRGLEEERRQWLDQQARERLNMERARENLLEEQRSSTSQLGEERRALAEERSKFQVEQRVTREKMQQDALKKGQAEADYEILTRTIHEEKSQHAQRLQDLRKEEERFERDSQKAERERAQLEREREELAQQARQIRQQSEQIDQVTETARRTQFEGEQAMEEAMQFNAQIEKREADLQRQRNAVKLMEEHVSQEKLRLAKEKKEVENLKSASLCTNCRSPLNGGPPSGHFSQPQNGYFTPQHSMARVQVNGFSMSAHQPSSNPLDQIAASIASDRALRLFKIQAMKDKEFLEEESMYLEGLRHTPYHPTASKS